MKAGYVRVSTREQDETNALEQQTARVEKAGAVIIFSDVESGRSDKRKEFNRMLTMCKQGKISEIICTRIDRLGRSVMGIHKAIATLEEYKVKLTILDSPVDSSSPFGWFSINQMAGLAEFESRLLSSRIKHGLDYFREEKKASPRPPFGYCRVDEKYAPDLSLHNGKTKWAIAKDIIEYFLQPGSTLRKTAQYVLKTYNISWTAAGLKYWLTNPVLKGNTAYNIKGNLNNPERWIIHDNTHQPLITQAEFNFIQEKLAVNRNRYSYGNNKNNHELLPLEGQIICGSCGYKCFCLRKHSTYRIRCKKHETLGSNFCENRISSYLPKIIEAVDQKLIQRYQEIQEYTVDNLEIEEEDPELIDRQKQLQSLRMLPSSKIIQEAIDQTILEINSIKQRKVEKDKIDNNLVKILESCYQDKNYWDSIPWEDKRRIYKELVNFVKVLNGEILEIKLLV